MENSLKEIYDQNNTGIFIEEELKEVREKELKREELMAREEELLRLKSRAIWIKEGDKNTKFFHLFSTHKRNMNTILTIKDMNAELVYPFKEKAEVGEWFFKNLFKESEGCNIQEILKVISLFPRLINEEMNNFLKEEVTEEELEKTVYSLHKGKSPGPYGFILAFFQGFFILLKEIY